MKIILICGSPRRNGNTAKIIEKVREVLKDTAANVELIYLSDYKINGCLGCSHCQSVLDKAGCVQEDDVSKLLANIIEADAVLYATPLYGHSYSGQLKLLMDRHVALIKFVDGGDKSVNEMEILSFIKDKPVGLIVSCQGPEEDNTELIKAQFDKFCESSLSRCLGKYVFPWCNPNSTQSEFSGKTLHKISSDIQELILK